MFAGRRDCGEQHAPEQGPEKNDLAALEVDTACDYAVRSEEKQCRNVFDVRNRRRSFSQVKCHSHAKVLRLFGTIGKCPMVFHYSVLECI